VGGGLGARGRWRRIGRTAGWVYEDGGGGLEGRRVGHAWVRGEDVAGATPMVLPYRLCYGGMTEERGVYRGCSPLLLQKDAGEMAGSREKCHGRSPALLQKDAGEMAGSREKCHGRSPALLQKDVDGAAGSREKRHGRSPVLQRRDVGRDGGEAGWNGNAFAGAATGG